MDVTGKVRHIHVWNKLTKKIISAPELEWDILGWNFSVLYKTGRGLF